jgi:hypothetical protein
LFGLNIGGRGIGTALLARVAHAAEQEKRRFLRWAVLNWDQSLAQMDAGLGADFMDEWRTVLLAGEG